jgi:hypothetical protein
VNGLGLITLTTHTGTVQTMSNAASGLSYGCVRKPSVTRSFFFSLITKILASEANSRSADEENNRSMKL